MEREGKSQYKTTKSLTTDLTIAFSPLRLLRTLLFRPSEALKYGALALFWIITVTLASLLGGLNGLFHQDLCFLSSYLRADH